MVAQKGKDLLLKIDKAGSFMTGRRVAHEAHRLQQRDITDADYQDNPSGMAPRVRLSCRLSSRTDFSEPQIGRLVR
jgi:hypothetical protein